MNLFTEECKVSLVQAALADGQTDVDSSRVNMGADGGYDGVCFICILGTITGAGTVTMAAKQAATDIVGDALSGASAEASGNADSDKLLIVDIFRPTDPYLGVTLTRATANSVVGGVLAIQYRGRVCPVTQAAAMLAADLVKVVSPAES